MRLAAELHLPLMTVIDTPGAALSVEAEEGGLAGEIARCLADLVTLDAPDAVPAARRGQRRRRARAAAGRPGGRRAARLAVPAAARGRERDRAPRPRRTRRTWRGPRACASLDLRRDGIVDRIVAERPDAADEPEEFCARLSDVLRFELAALMQRDSATVTADRAARYRALGRV